MTTILVAASGGHLKELHELRERIPAVTEGPVRWVTFDSPQARSLLVGEDVEFVPFVGPRDLAGAVRNVRHAHRILKTGRPTRVLSTGSAIAVPFFAVARSRGVACSYIESAARLEGPSLTGRILSAIPGVRLHTQYASWGSGRWRFGGSVFDSFTSAAVPASGRLDRVVVTVGTPHGYDFSRLVRRLARILPSEAEILWQTGDSDVAGLSIDAREAVSEDELRAAMEKADLVVAHAGVGTAMAALETGHRPLLVPRRLARGEHVDDHQVQVAGELSRRGLAVSVEADELTLEHLLAAAGRRVERTAQVPSFDISD